MERFENNELVIFSTPTGDVGIGCCAEIYPNSITIEVISVYNADIL